MMEIVNGLKYYIFNYENNPSTLIYVDNSGAKNKYRATSIEKVQDLLNTKQVVDY